MLAVKALRYLAGIQPRYPVPVEWALGGGTRLMLDFAHRISDDIDIFVPDPNVLALLSPAVNDQIEDEVSSYDVDHGAVKLRFAGVGEIDFICCRTLVGGPTSDFDLGEGRTLVLESVAEVFAKKLFHRGDRITPRDVFDWWFVGTKAPEALNPAALALALQGKLDGIGRELEWLQRQEQDAEALAAPMAAWEKIRSPYLPRRDEALAWARRYVEELKGLVPPAH